MTRTLLLAFALVATAAPALAETRNYTVTGFDRIRVDGPYQVSVTTNSGTFARATGSAAAIDRLSLRVENNTLIVGVDPGGWSSTPERRAGPLMVEAGTANLSVATVNGAGSLKITAVRGPDFALNMQGSGVAEVAGIDVDRLKVGLAGASSARLSGQALNLTAIVRGTGAIDASAVTARDAVLGAEGPTIIRANVSNTVKVDASGVAAVTLAGNPSCRTNTVGSAAVSGCREQAGGR